MQIALFIIYTFPNRGSELSEQTCLILGVVRMPPWIYYIGFPVIYVPTISIRPIPLIFLTCK